MMTGLKITAVCAAALLLDAFLGDPARLPHPVILMGRAISRLETLLRAAFPKTRKGELLAGCLLALLLPLGTLAASCGILLLARRLHPALFWILQIFWCWQCLAMKGLADEAENVRKTLETGTLTEARKAVGRIVGRDTENLTAADIVRAAVESVAENFSDGVLAPLFWMLPGGAPLALCYKAINTMDSMVGYKNERYLFFGRAAARLDDAANWLPARLSALLLILAALPAGEDARGAFRIWRRDRRKHESPNSAQTEAAAAGALGLRLGGPTRYFGQMHQKPWLGDGVREPQTADITRAVKLMKTAALLGLLLLGAARILTGGLG